MKQALLLAAATTLLYASDYTAIYTRIDRVVLEPATGDANAVQVWGVFSIANPADRNTYGPPTRGYLYLKLDRNPEAARIEWNDFKKLSGTGDVVGFGSRTDPPPRLRLPNEKPDKPDAYTAGNMPTKFRGDTRYPPVRSLLDFKD